MLGVSMVMICCTNLLSSLLLTLELEKLLPVLLKLLILLSKLEDEAVLEVRAFATALLITGLKADITLFTIVLV